MDLRQLECFLEVKSQLHFGRAAERLYLAQPTVSESIRRLERELGGALFDRTTRRVTLTPLGEAFAVDAQQAYAAVQVAYERGRAMAEQQGQQFSVGYTGDYDPLVDVVAQLQREQRVLVTLRAMSTPRLVTALGDRKLHAGDLLGAHLRRQVVHARARRVAPRRRRARRSPARRARPRLRAGAGPRTARSVASFGQPGRVRPVRGSHGSNGRPLGARRHRCGGRQRPRPVLSGFGVGLLYQAIADTRRAPGVSYVRVEDDAIAFERKLVWRRDERHPALEPFVALLRERHAEPAAPRA